MVAIERNNMVRARMTIGPLPELPSGKQGPLEVSVLMECWERDIFTKVESGSSAFWKMKFYLNTCTEQLKDYIKV